MLSQGSDGGTMTGFDEPAMSPSGGFANWSHEALKASVDGMQAASVQAIADRWNKIGTGLENSLIDLSAAIGRLNADDEWTGATAEAAAAAHEEYLNLSHTAALNVADVGVSMNRVVNAVETLKNGLPQPVTVDTGFWANVFGDGGAKEAEEAERRAREFMTNNYRPGYEPADRSVPTLPRVPAPLDAADDVVGPAGSRWPGPGSNGGGAGGGTAEMVGGGESVPPSEPEQAVTAEPQTGQQPPLGDSSSTPASNPASTSAASAAGISNPAVAPSLGAAGSGSGFSGGGGGFSGGGGSGAGPSLVGPGPVSGAPGAGAGTSAGTSAGALGPAAANAGMRGGTPMGGMMGAGRGGGGGEDKEHQTPAYLYRIENGSALIGKLPPAFPPVLGA